MSRKVLIPLLFVTFLAVFAVCSADSSDADICDDVKVYIQDPVTDDYEMTVVSGVQTVRAAVQAAMDAQGHVLELNLTETNIKSVDGYKNTKDWGWRLFQWLPDGNKDWGMQTFQEKSDERMRTGCTLCVTKSTSTMSDNIPVYSVPDFKPKSTGYVFIRFANGFNPDEGTVNEVFTPEIRQEGFWIEGEGTNMGEVLVDAVNRNWPGQIEVMDGDIEGTELASWIVSLFGLKTVNLGDGAYAYWSQWTWQDHSWGYNNWTLGYYDPAVYKYVECIYLISSIDPYDGSIVADKGGPEPNPDTDEIVCMKNKLTISFNVDGVTRQTVEGKYGKTVDMTEVAIPTKPGMGFTGWGDVTVPLYADTVFEASFVPITDTMVSVTYYLEDGVTLIAREYMEPGSPAVYAGVPTKPMTAKYIYTFREWDADLSSVTGDISVKPLFDAEIREYEVHFYDYDRTLITTIPVKYESPAVLPDAPVREHTVMYQFEFVGWSITPNSYKPVDLSSITQTTYAYAYYKPSPALYKVTFMDGSVKAGETMIPYGSPIGGSYSLTLFAGQYLAKMYQDPGFEKECPVNTIVLGDTTVYVKKVPGAYSAEIDASGHVSDTIHVSVTPEIADLLETSGGRTVICDISQFPNGTSAVVDRASLTVLKDRFGGDFPVTLVVPRGFLTMTVSAMLSAMEDEGEVSFCISNGPSSVKISTALKKLDYRGFYRVDFRAGNHSVMDLAEFGVSAEVGIDMGQETETCNVWNIRPSGATSVIKAQMDGRYAVFSTDLLQFYAVGSSDIAQEEVRIIDPYGTVDFEKEGEGMFGEGTLKSITIDSDGGTLFIPSSYRGCTLRHMIAGSLNSAVNTEHVVIPVTVSSFSWESWTNPTIRHVYFLGDCPVMEGTIPAGVEVHVRPDVTGWDGTGASEDLILHTYNGSYKKDVFGFTYYLVNGEVVLHRYVYGVYVDIPDAISVNEAQHPVAYIDDGAFMQSDNPAVRQLYDLIYDKYMLETVEIGSGVREIMSRAFYGSRLVGLITPESVEHVWDEAFKDAWRLNVVRFSDNLLFIGRSAFEGCTDKSFARFDMPDSVRQVGVRAFLGCTEMTKVVFGSGITSIPAGCFEGCVRLTDLDIPDGVTSIGDRAFYDCSGLLYADLNNVETVGDQAFRTVSKASSMEFIVLGKNLRSFGAEAFWNCGSISEIEAHCPHFDSFEGAFDRDMTQITVYCSDDVLGEWPGYNAEPLVEKIPEKDNTLLLSVEIGLIVMFAVIGALSYRSRQKLRN